VAADISGLWGPAGAKAFFSKETAMSEANSSVGGVSMSSDREALRQKAVAAKDAVVDLAGEARRYAGHRMSDLKEHASGWAQGAKEKAGDANEQVIHFVRTNPYKSLAIAAGVGLLAGALLKRRW
jgi:ElaB/YqjD/DUF883 family membrane-anchored ribosome-binding protein